MKASPLLGVARNPALISDTTYGPVLATSPISEKTRYFRVTLACHAEGHTRARRHRGRHVSLTNVPPHRARLAPAPTHGAATLGRQAARHAVRPDRPGRPRRHHADLEERAAHCPTRNASSLAPRRLQGSV